MSNKPFVKFGLLILLILISVAAYTQAPADDICGRWQSEEKNLIVDVYKQGDNYQAKIIWFNAGNDKLMHEWIDKNNPNKALQTRKILGMNVLSGLVYEPSSNSWEDGMIYDAKHGKDWNASAYIDKSGLLKVKGYWHFKIFGRTMTFARVCTTPELK